MEKVKKKVTDFSLEFSRAVLRLNKDGLTVYRKVDYEKKLDIILRRMERRYPGANLSILHKLKNLRYIAPECAVNYIGQHFLMFASQNKLDEFSGSGSWAGIKSRGEP